MTGWDGVSGFPPLRQKEVAKTGHGTVVTGRRETKASVPAATCGGEGVEALPAGNEAGGDVAGGLLDVIGAAKVAPVELIGAIAAD